MIAKKENSLLLNYHCKLFPTFTNCLVLRLVWNVCFVMKMSVFKFKMGVGTFLIVHCMLSTSQLTLPLALREENAALILY